MNTINQNYLQKISRIALSIAVIGLAVSAFGFLTNKPLFAFSYMSSYLFWIGIVVGSFPLILIHHLTSGGWGFLIRRVLEIVTKMTPIFLILFLPVLFCMKELYHWTHSEALLHDPILKSKEAFLNTPFFTVRLFIYFAIWSALSFFLNKFSLSDDSKTGDISSKLPSISAAGLVLYGFTVTFASIDWVMSLEPHWFSTIYGMIFMVSFALSGLAFAIIIICLLKNAGLIHKSFSVPRCHDLGSLLFAFTMLWAYVSISQFIIIWSGNLAEETPWYIHRFRGNWYIWKLVILALHFVLPFFCLLMRQMKRKIEVICIIAMIILMMRWFEMIWYVKPVLKNQLHFGFLDISSFAFIGGIFVFCLCKQLLKQPLDFNKDPIEQEEDH